MANKKARRALKHRLIRKWKGFAKMHKYGDYGPLNYIDRVAEASYRANSSSITGIYSF